MGMYTQAMGMLNIHSINAKMKELIAYKELLEATKEAYCIEHPNTRNYICKDTHIETGSNDTIFIFFGTELKNYDNDIESWIKYLIKSFPSCEGIVSSQYEENDKAHLYFIKGGKIVHEMESPIETNGYGNGL